ncbi:MAG: S1 RNA-binding domain-containing protein [Phycisphaerales bacterium]|nr:S1 RNA-binding domain-containing protein [Phycisphaerales bacterium]
MNPDCPADVPSLETKPVPSMSDTSCSAEQVPPDANPETMAEACPVPAEKPNICDGVVVRLTAEYVFMDLGDQGQGAIPLIEFAGQPLPAEGEKISVLIDKQDPDTGLFVLSKRQAEEMNFWDSVKLGDELEGVVTGMNKGGLDIDIGGARVFMPASHVDVKRVHDISVLIGEHVRGVVTQVDRATRDLLLSRRKYLQKEQKRQRTEMIESLVIGETRSGTVSNITEFGAFVDIGGIDGLVHVTDMSWGHVKDPKELLQLGQTVDVKLLKINRQTGKLSLGIKQLQPDPWEGVEQKYAEGAKLSARIDRMTDFGAFLELEPGIDALLPLSEMSWSKHVNHPSQIVKIGDTIEVVVLKVDPAKKRISVGLRQMTENPWSTVAENFPINSMHKGKVAKLAEFGAFVELVPGLEGLIHISELSEKRVRAVGDVVQEGQEVEVRIVRVDMESQRIGLSMRPAPAPRSAADGRNKPQKKRPLRGGLSSHFSW